MTNSTKWLLVKDKPRLLELAVDSNGDVCAQPKDRTVDLQDIYDKLYAYEQAEAESLIVVLPVSEGTIVYELKKSCEPVRCSSLLTGKPLMTVCPRWDKCNGKCIDSDKAPIKSPENTNIAIDTNCFNRFYLQPVVFDVSMRDYFSNYGKRRLFVSESDARKVLQDTMSRLHSMRHLDLDFDESKEDVLQPKKFEF